MRFLLLLVLLSAPIATAEEYTGEDQARWDAYVTANAIDELNAIRAHSGVGPLRECKTLQAAAWKSAGQQARTGSMHHCKHIGSRSGVGYASGQDLEGHRFRSCYSHAGHRGFAGAAAISNGRATFYALDLSGRCLCKDRACEK